MISVIHPSRGRPEKAKATYENWMQKAANKESIDWVLSIDSGDPRHNDYSWTKRLISAHNKCAVDAINRGAKTSIGQILMVVSDDTECPTGWDIFIYKWSNTKTDFICKVDDGTQPWIITMPIMDRTYYNRFGYIYHPDYQHMFCDTELTCVADLTGRKITSNILFKHNHYSVTKEPPDAISKRADGTWDQGEKLFLERYKRNFDLKPEDIKGKIQDSNMINWLLRKQRR